MPNKQTMRNCQTRKTKIALNQQCELAKAYGDNAKLQQLLATIRTCQLQICQAFRRQCSNLVQISSDNACCHNRPVVMRMFQKPLAITQVLTPCENKQPGHILKQQSGLVQQSGDNANSSRPQAKILTGQPLQRQRQMIKFSSENASWSNLLATIRTGHAFRRQCELIKSSGDNVD